MNFNRYFLLFQPIEKQVVNKFIFTVLLQSVYGTVYALSKQIYSKYGYPRIDVRAF